MLNFWLVENMFQGARDAASVAPHTCLLGFVRSGPEHWRGEGHNCVIGGVAIGGVADARLRLAIIALAANAIAQGYCNTRFNPRTSGRYHPPGRLADIVSRCIRSVSETFRATRLMCLSRGPHHLKKPGISKEHAQGRGRCDSAGPRTPLEF